MKFIEIFPSFPKFFQVCKKLSNAQKFLPLKYTTYEFTCQKGSHHSERLFSDYVLAKSRTLQMELCIIYISHNIHWFFSSSFHSSLHSLQIHTSFSSLSAFLQTFLLSVLKMLVFNFPLPLINHQIPLACLAQSAFLLFSFLVSLVQHHNFL